MASEGPLPTNVPMIQVGARWFRLSDALQALGPPITGQSTVLTESVLPRSDLQGLEAAIEEIKRRLTNAGIP